MNQLFQMLLGVVVMMVMMVEVMVMMGVVVPVFSKVNFYLRHSVVHF